MGEQTRTLEKQDSSELLEEAVMGEHTRTLKKNDSELLEEAVMGEMTNGAFYLSGKRGNNSASSLAPWSPDDRQAICQQQKTH